MWQKNDLSSETFDFSFKWPDIHTFCTVNISQTKMGGNRDFYWEKPADLSLKNSSEEKKGSGESWGKYTSDIVLDWPRSHLKKNTTAYHINAGKNKADWGKARGLHETGGTLSVLLWGMWDVSSKYWVTTEGQSPQQLTCDRKTSLPLLQCLMAILHILDSAMVGQGIVSLGGFFTMCRVRVSRPHL